MTRQGCSSPPVGGSCQDRPSRAWGAGLRTRCCIGLGLGIALALSLAGASLGNAWATGKQGAEATSTTQGQGQETRAPQGAEPVRLTVMTYNIHHGEGRDGRWDLERIAQVIEEAGADLVGLQEVDQNWSARSQFSEEANWLAKRLGMQVAFAAALTRPTLLGAAAGYGNALLSRYPIVAQRRVLLPKQDTREDRSLLVGEVQVGSVRWQVGVTHLGLSRVERLAHVRTIWQELQGFSGPTVLMGDWNDRPDSPEVALVTVHLQDVAAAAQAQDGQERPTFRYDSPDGRPNVQIDYIFATPHIDVERVWTIDSIASDHLALVAQLKPEGVVTPEATVGSSKDATDRT